jgi:hypothetical protein
VSLILAIARTWLSSIDFIFVPGRRLGLSAAAFVSSAIWPPLFICFFATLCF